MYGEQRHDSNSRDSLCFRLVFPSPAFQLHNDCGEQMVILRADNGFSSLLTALP